MKNTKRILAIAGVILLAALYLATLIFALIGSPWAMNCLKVSVGLTILIPVLLWIWMSMFRFISDRKSENEKAASGEDEA